MSDFKAKMHQIPFPCLQRPHTLAVVKGPTCWGKKGSRREGRGRREMEGRGKRAGGGMGP